jgi:hypothetical protein
MLRLFSFVEDLMGTLVKDGTFLVCKSEEKRTKTGAPFQVLTVRASEEQGGKETDAKIWENVLNRHKGEGRPGVPVAGQLLTRVTYKDDEYLGKPQFILEAYQLATDEERKTLMPQFRGPPAVNVPKALDKIFRWEKWPSDLNVLLSNIETEFTQKDLLNKFCEIPAGAKNHHSRRAGLLQHILEMIDIAECLTFGCFMTHFPNMIDFPILRASIILHDIGKVLDYDEDTLGYDPVQEGVLLTHVPYGSLLVERNWPKAESESRKIKLQHCILAHHGKGISPVNPIIPEASMIHYIDAISAYMDVHRTAQSMPEEEIPFNNMLGGKSHIFKHSSVNQ